MNNAVMQNMPHETVHRPAESGSWWNLASVAAGDRTDAWQQVLNDTYCDWQLPSRLPASFQARLQRLDLEGIGWVECVCDPCAGERTPQQLRRQSDSEVGVQLVLAGRERFNTTGGSIEVGSGDLVVWTNDKVIDFEVVEPLHKLTLMIPRALLQQHLTPRQHWPKGGKLDTRLPAATLLASHLAALTGRADALDVGMRRAAHRWTLDLLGAAMAPARSNRDPAGGGAMLRQVQWYAMQHLHDGELTPSRIAAAHRMSLRQLHLLFQREGLAVAGWIQEQRLQRCHQDLLDPSCRHHQIGEIAYRWGFVSAAHFSRAYRNRFGLSPRATRASTGRP